MPGTRITTYGMEQRSDRSDFYIRDKRGRAALTSPHRHEYFQIQINLGGDTVQHIGGAVRPFPKKALAFILPHRLHVIPHPEDGDFMLINFSQGFFLPQLTCDPLDLEDIPIGQAPELSPFRFQEQLDFVFDGAQGGIGAVVVDHLVRPAVFEHTALLAEIAGAFFHFIENQAADFGAEYIVVTVVLRQGLAQANFREARAVERRSVEVTHALVPGCFNGGLRLFFRNRAEHVAQWGGAKTQHAGQFVFQAHGVNPQDCSRSLC